MTRKRAGVAQHTDHGKPDPRFPQPQSPTPTRCQTEPQLFDRDYGDSRKEKELEKARRACSGCPIVTDCLKWALVNADLTKVGIFAATTPHQRKELRQRLDDRLGPDWIDILAHQDQIRRERAAAARHTPLPVNQARIVRLDRQVNGPMPTHRLLTPELQQRNRTRLTAGLKAAS